MKLLSILYVLQKPVKKETVPQIPTIAMPAAADSQPPTQEQQQSTSPNIANQQPPTLTEKTENELEPSFPPPHNFSTSVALPSSSSSAISTTPTNMSIPPSSDPNSRIMMSPPPPSSAIQKSAVQTPPHVQQKQKLNQQQPPPRFHSENPTRTPVSATVLTVPEPQQLSPLLRKISPPFTISSLSNVVRSPTSPFIPNPHSPYPPNTPSTPRTPVTPVSDTGSNKSEPSDSAGKEKKPKRPKLTKHEREHNKMMREQKKKMVGDKKDQQWKVLQQQRIFEQQRQAILNKSKALAMDTMHPSQRFNATMNSSLAEDALQHSLMMKAKAEAAQIHSSGMPHSTAVNTMQTNTSASIFSRTNSTSVVTTTATSSSALSSSSSDKLSEQTPSSNEVLRVPPSSEHFSQQHQEMMQQQAASKGMHGATGNPTDPFNSFMNEHLDPRIRSSEQHKAFLYQQQQQQQYMASQQQYIQWQLAQQAAGNMYSQKSGQKSSLESDKGESGGMSESDEQERMRLFNQRQQMLKNPPPSHQLGGEKRPGEHPNNSHFMLPDGRPVPPTQSGNHGFPQPPPPRGGQFPGANSPEAAALYQQMFMEYFMRYRKSQGIDTSQFPSHELYMMAEFAKQSFARQMQQYGKGFPQMSSQSNHPMQDPYGKPMPPPPPGPHNFRGPPQPEHYGDWGRGPPVSSMSHLEMLAHQHSAQASALKSPPPPGTKTIQQTQKAVEDHKQQQQPSQSKPTHSGSGLPKSASFQISRIAADSTSNDDFPPNNNISKSGTFHFFFFFYFKLLNSNYLMA